MNRIIIYILLAISTIVFPNICHAESADKLIDNVAKKLNSAKSLQVHFILSSNGKSVKGQMLIAGNKFYVETPQIAAWHNGKLQWVLNKSDNEVNLSEPDPVEIRQINPLSVISDFKSNFTPSFAKSTSPAKSVVTLSPKSSASEISSATLTVNKANSMPESVKLSMKNGQTITINITSIKTGNKINDNVFKFDKKKYPAAQLIDLR